VQSANHDRVFICGRPGEGKSALAGYLIRQWPRNFVWVFDPTHDKAFALYKRCDLDNPPPRRNCLVLLDEADRLAGSQRYEADWVRELVNRGRNNNVTWICAAKRPQTVHRDVTSFATVAYIFALTGSRDVDYLVDEWGDRCELVRDLGEHEFMRIYPRNYREALTVHKLRFRDI